MKATACCDVKERAMQSLRPLALAAGTIGVIWSSPAAAEDWATPITAAQKSLANAGVNLSFGVTEFGQGLAAGDGNYGVQFGGKADVLLGLDGGRLGLWNGFGVSAHLEQEFGQNANMQGDGSIVPVNTALALPLLGGSTTDLSLNVSQKFGDNVSVSLGKFNMLDKLAATPLIGGGGETTFWNLGLAAPISGVTPAYILGGILSVKTTPATFTLMVYDPRTAQDPHVVDHPFAEGATTSLSATIPVPLFGLSGFHTFRVAYSSATGLDFDTVGELLLPTGSGAVDTKQGYYYGSYAFQQFLWQDPDKPNKGWGLFGQIAVSDGNPNPVSTSVFLGLGGSTPGRLDDRWGVAWFDYMFSPQLETALNTALAAIGQGLRDEKGLETYYDMAIADHIRFGPDAQVIWPGTLGKATAIFLGARARLVF
jgi:porin